MCPHCGLGVLPRTKYCMRCGQPLPELPPTEEEVAAEEKRRRWRAVIWFFDIFPGLLSARVVAASLVAFIIACVLGMAAAGVGAGLTNAGLAAVFLLPLAVLAGGLGVLTLVAGLTWLVYGKVCPPWEAWGDLRTRHWGAIFVLGIIALRVFVLIGSLFGR